MTQNNVPQDIVVEKLMKELHRTQWSKVLRYFESKHVGGCEAFLATDAFTKVGRYVNNHPGITLEHATAILWRAAEQVFLDFIKPKKKDRFDKPFENLDLLEDGHRKNNVTDIVANDEMINLACEDLKQLPYGLQLYERCFEYRSWQEIGSRMGTSGPTAQTRAALALAGLVLRMEKRGLNDTLLRKLRRLYGRKGVSAARMWVEGVKPKNISAELHISLLEAQNLHGKVIAFFKEHVAGL